MGAYDMVPGLLGGNYGLQPPMQRPMPALQPQAQQTMGGRVGGIFGDFMSRLKDMQQNNPQALLALGTGMMQGDLGAGFAGAGDAMAQYREQMAGQQEKQRQDSLTKRYLMAKGISEEEADAAAANPAILSELLKRAGGVEQTDTMRNLAWRADQAGLQPGTQAYNDFMISGGSKGITVDARNMGSIPPGYSVEYDAQGRPVRMTPIPGGPEDTTAASAAANEGRMTSTDTITGAAATARQIAKSSGRLATGVGGQILSGIGESSAAELRRQVDVLKSNASIENLTAMRRASPTGGALGAVSDRENAMLAAKSGALDPTADPAAFMRSLDDYERTLLRIVHGHAAGDAIFERTRDDNTVPAPGGVIDYTDYFRVP